MLYPILIEYYVWFCLALLLVTWIARSSTPESRTNFMYGYGLIGTLGFLLGLDWVGGIIFGLLVLELGRVFKRWLNRQEAKLKK
jgi:hypothetical protein